MAQNLVVRWSKPEVILVATNLLEGQSLILHGIYQAKLSNARVLLVHVIPSFSPVVDGRPGVVTSFLPSPTVRAVNAELEKGAKEFQREGISCEPILLTGAPAEEIALLVKSRGVDRVICATRYASGIARLVEASIAEELIATVDAPVCIIGRHAQTCPGNGTPPRRILLATSLHSGSSVLVEFASTLAKTNNGQLTLLHVINTEGISDQRRAMIRFTARQKLSALFPAEGGHKNQPELIVSEGSPAPVILDTVRSMSQDAVILGSPHSPHSCGFLPDGVVHRVVVESICPVITVKSCAVCSAEHIHDRTRADTVFAHRGK
jgi:nucleotide-binding universal stress UspA family protein